MCPPGVCSAETGGRVVLYLSTLSVPEMFTLMLEKEVEAEPPPPFVCFGRNTSPVPCGRYLQAAAGGKVRYVISTR